MTKTTQSKGGRPSGSGWANKRAAGVRKAAKANQIAILADRDPLAELIRIGFEEEDVNVRVRALSAALPHLYPRLSMSVVATADQQQSERITSDMLRNEILDRIARLPPPIEPIRDAEIVPDESETDYQTVV